MIFLFEDFVCQKFLLNRMGGRDINQNAYLIITAYLGSFPNHFHKLNSSGFYLVHVNYLTFTSLGL